MFFIVLLFFLTLLSPINSPNRFCNPSPNLPIGGPGYGGPGFPGYGLPGPNGNIYNGAYGGGPYGYPYGFPYTAGAAYMNGIHPIYDHTLNPTNTPF